MTQKVRYATRTGVRRPISPHSVLLIALVLSAVSIGSVLVSAADSELDASFDEDGIVTTDHREFEQLNDIAIQPDGKIVAAGHSGIFHESIQEPLGIMVVRYNVDGSLDSTFGAGGIVTTDIGTYSKAWGVAVQPDGKIVAVGRSGSVLHSDFTVVRYNANGSLDATFGTGGIVTTPFGSFSQIQDVAIQADGKIVVTGDAPGFGAAVFLAMFTVARYNADGSLDVTFDGDGVSQAVPAGFPLSPTIVPLSIAVQTNQRLVVGGNCGINSTLQGCVSRYNSDGSLDNTFDGDGLVITEFDASQGSIIEGVSIQPDGKIVAGGSSFTPTGGIPALARYNIDGSLDTSFDGDGRVTTPNSLQFRVENLALQSNGKILMVGDGFISDPLFHSAITVARWNSDGSLDETFASGGMVTTSVGTLHSGGKTVAVQPDGRIVAGGFGNFTFDLNGLSFSDFALVRFGVALNPPPEAWATGGGWIVSPPGAFALMPDATGKATFSFVAKHHEGASVPTGSANFLFGGMNFQSTSYERLVISDHKKAQCHGVGTINGSGNFRFMVTTIDGDRAGGDGQDKFRIKIWNDSAVIYDNQFNAPDNADPTSALRGGSIVIHH